MSYKLDIQPEVFHYPEFEEELSGEVTIGGSSPKPRVLTYSKQDVIDERISVPAQYSLVRLSKNPSTSIDAVGMLEAVKSGRLTGIYCVNWKTASDRAEMFGKHWWEVIPYGEDAVLMLNPNNLRNGPPMIVFRRELDPRNDKGCGSLRSDKSLLPSPAKLDMALHEAWRSFCFWRAGKLKKCLSVDLWVAELLQEIPIRNVFPSGYCITNNSIIPVSYEQPIELSVWAEHRHTRGIICNDARLKCSGTTCFYPEGNIIGQAGWNWGIHYNSLLDLATKLRAGEAPHYIDRPAHTCHSLIDRVLIGKCAHFLIYRLGICAHGSPGNLQVNGPSETSLSSSTISTFDTELDLIEKFLTPNATVLLYGCNAGAGDSGSNLLEKLSMKWPGRKVVAFTTVMTFGWRRMRSGESCSEPSYRDTSCFNHSSSEDVERKRYGKDWDNLAKLPWGSEMSPYAKIALNGHIIKAPGPAPNCHP